MIRNDGLDVTGFPGMTAPKSGSAEAPKAAVAAIRIAADRDKVWNLVTQVSQIANWYESWDVAETDAVSDRVEVGTVFRLRRHRFPIAATAHCHVITVDEPNVIRWIETSGLRPPLLVEFRIEPDGEEATTVSYTRRAGTRTPRRGRR